MTKDLYDLTVEEFTRLLLDYEEEYHLDLTLYDEDFKKETYTLIGTYEQLRDDTVMHPRLYNQIADTLFDYRLVLNDLDIFDFLEFKTKGFNPQRVKIILRQMDCFYLLTYTEELDSEVMQYYINEGLDIPYLHLPARKLKHTIVEEMTIPDYRKMREKVYPFREFTYHKTIALLESKIKKTSCHNKTSLPSCLPEELNTPEAKKLLDKAVEYNLLEEGYKWSSKLMTKRELAYLCYVLSNKLELSSIMSKTDDGRNETNWKPFKELFNDNNLNNNLRGITTDDILTNTMDKIKGIYDF